MAVIIGFSTVASFGGACVISANWGASPNTQRFYCLGNMTPHMSISKPTETLNLSVYSGHSNTFDASPSSGCDDADGPIVASISPAACDGAVAGMSGNWFLQSYSYQKDDSAMPGQESWGLIRWIEGVGGVAPSYILKGISEGQGTANCGITFDGATVSSFTGSVSAGQIGRADTIQMGQVGSIATGSNAAGETGQGSASIQYTQLYI